MATIKGSFNFTIDNLGNLTGWFVHNRSISPALTTATLNTPYNGSYIGKYSTQWDDGKKKSSSGFLEINLKPNTTNIYTLEWKNSLRGKNKFYGEGMLNAQQNVLAGWYED